MISRHSGDQEGKTFYRRRLPHYQPPGATFFVTYRLAGSLPTEVIVRLKEEREESERRIRAAKSDVERGKLLHEEEKRYFGRFDAFLDAATTGPKWLNQPEVAGVVAGGFHKFDAEIMICWHFASCPIMCILFFQWKILSIPSELKFSLQLQM